MRYLVLDGRRMRTREAAHAYIARKLRLPDYYGANLDALYDCLTDVHEDTELAIKYVRTLHRHLGAYGQRLTDTFSDAAKHNAHIHIQLYDSWR